MDMKKKIALFCVAALVFCLLPGCSADMPEITTDAAETTVIPEETTAADLFDVPGRKDIYFATGNDYYDLYWYYSHMPGPEIRVLTRKPVDIRVSADIQAEYTVSVFQQERGRSLTTYVVKEQEGMRIATPAVVGVHDLPVYIYQTYAGMDWEEVGKLRAEYHELKEEYDAGEGNYEEMIEARNRRSYAETEYIQEYTELNMDDLPVFYEYLVQIWITDAEVEETLKTVQITVDDTVYDVDIGEIRIMPFKDIKNSGNTHLALKMSPPLMFPSAPYGNGVDKCQSGVYYAQTGLTLTGLHFLESSVSSLKVLDVTAVIADDEGMASLGDGIRIEWDGATPIYVEQGKYICFHMTIQDDRMKELSYHGKLYPVFEFECGGETYERLQEIPFLRIQWDEWILYAAGLDGIDLESYYNNYYYLTAEENWRYEVDLTPWGQEK